ncbi:MAG TPA: type IV pilus modification protein PilV [Pseudoxanthomonas sp.]|nr:type IV pilus modification protein PilV [Pseudoxanthomonas sp.]
MRLNPPLRSPRRASGFTMIEVLIAILVLAFGLLGFAFLQTMNVRFTKSAEQRTVATNLAYELVDMMRSQRSLGSYYNLIKPASFDDVVVPASGCARPVSATPAANIARWKCEVSAALPDGTANVVLKAEGALTVEIFWGDDNWSESAKVGVSTVKVETRL